MWARTKPEYKALAVGCGFVALITLVLDATDASELLKRIIVMPLGVLAIFWFIGTGMAYDQLEKQAKLEKLLTSPDVEEKFTALSVRLTAKDAAQLKELQEAMKVGQRRALELAKEIEARRAKYQEIIGQEGREQETAEAVSALLETEVIKVAEILERRNRPSQWLFLILGAVLGVAIQALAQWIF